MLKKSKTRQKGFTAVDATVAVAIIATVVLGGWYVLRARNNAAEPKNSSSTSQSPKPYSPSQQTTDKYLTIAEWGVRFTLPLDLREDISYFMNDRAEKLSGGPVLADLVSKQFSAGNLKCAEAEGDTPRSLISIERLANKDGVTMSDPAPIKQLGNYTYYFAGTACQEAINREGSTADKKLLSALKDAVTGTLETY